MRSEVPGIIGTNVLQLSPDFKEFLVERSQEKLENEASFIVRCETYTVPANCTSLVEVKIGNNTNGELMYIEPFTKGVKGSLYLSPGVISAEMTCSVPVINMSKTKDIILSPGTKLGTAAKFDFVNTDLQFQVDVKEVIVSCRKSSMSLEESNSDKQR